MPHPGKWSELPVTAAQQHIYDVLAGKKEIERPKEIDEMTLAEINAKYGNEVSDFILRLKGRAEMWERIATERAANQA